MTYKDTTDAALSAERQDAADQVKSLTDELNSVQAALVSKTQEVTNDVTEIDSLNAQISSLQATITDLQNQLHPPPPPPPAPTTLYGTNLGGWSKPTAAGAGPYETATQAEQRIINAWNPAIVRVWFNKTPDATVWATYTAKYPGRSLFFEFDVSSSDVSAGKCDAGMKAFCQAAPKDRRHYWTFNHEPDNKSDPPANWMPAASRLAKIHKANSPANLRSVLPLLMGGSYIKGRYPAAYGDYTHWMPSDLTGFDCIGTDSYQHLPGGKPDTMAFLLQPVIDAAKAHGLGLVVGELGLAYSVSDTQNTADIAALVKLIQSNGSLFEAVLAFESAAGASGPWCLMAGPNQNATNKTNASAAWAALCAASKK